MLSRRDLLLYTSKVILGAGFFSLLDEQRAHAITVAQGRLIVTNARSMLGIPFILGAPGFPRNTDCSRLTQAAYASAGIVTPRTALQQYQSCRFCTNMPGALIFFWTDNQRPRVVTHVGINVGNGSMINANSHRGRVVEENWSRSGYWRTRLITSATI